MTLRHIATPMLIENMSLHKVHNNLSCSSLRNGNSSFKASVNLHLCFGILNYLTSQQKIKQLTTKVLLYTFVEQLGMHVDRIEQVERHVLSKETKICSCNSLKITLNNNLGFWNKIVFCDGVKLTYLAQMVVDI